MEIHSYEDFCRMFQGDESERQRAELLWLLRDWLIRLSCTLEYDGETTGLDAILDQPLRFAGESQDVWKDELSGILDSSYGAVRAISGKMRENILRENVKMPVHKVREMNRYGMMWLSRRPGRTVREKVAGTDGIMAVRRRMSLDTGENRLFLAFLRLMSQTIQLKLESFSSSHLDREEETRLTLFDALLREEAMEEIRPWENLPPNNTLLSDKNYRKVWNAWNRLKKLDILTELDSQCLPVHLCTVFYVELLKRLRLYGHIPQVPVRIDGADYRISFQNIPVLRDIAVLYQLDWKPDTIQVDWVGGSQVAVFAENRIQIAAMKNAAQFPTTGQGLSDSLQMFLDELLGHRLSVKIVKQAQRNQTRKQDVPCSAVMDLFAIRPRYTDVDGDGQVLELKDRLLYQRWPEAEGLDPVDLPCNKSQAVYLGEDCPCCTIRSALEEASLDRLNLLTQLLETSFSARNLILLFPDMYNNLQLGLLHKAARLVYAEAATFPRSVGAAFYYQNSDEFRQSFHSDDFLLSLDLIGEDLTCTLVRGVIDQRTQSVVWERHPSWRTSIDTQIRDRLMRLERKGCREIASIYALLGMEGLSREAEEITFLRYDTQTDTWKCQQLSKEDIRSMPHIDVTEMVRTFKREQKALIGNSRVFVQNFSPLLTVGGTDFAACPVSIGPVEALRGYCIYQNLQKQADTPLWCDYLPSLSIKQLYGAFTLIDGQRRVMPRYGERTRIPIPNTFTLSKGQPKYQFDLIQSEASKSSSFVAEVRSSAFPLERDVECSLEMYYQYGSEEPFTLTFRPLDTVNAPFQQASVTWIPRSQVPYPVDGLAVPGYPADPGWDGLAAFFSKKGEINIPQRAQGIFRKISTRYYTTDLSGAILNVTGDVGKRRFSYPVRLEDGREVEVQFREKSLETVKGNPLIKDFASMGLVSFDLKEKLIKRYKLDLKHSGGWIWKRNQYGYFHFENNWKYEDEVVTLALFETDFEDGEFDSGLDYVSFEVQDYKPDKWGGRRKRAVNIRNAYQESDEQTFKYYAVRIRPGNRPGYDVTGPFMTFLLHRLSFAGKSVEDDGCPATLREAFYAARNRWLEDYRRCSDPSVKSILFRQLSLMARDLGDAYYELAKERITGYQSGQNRLPDEIGYALYDCSLEREKDLLARLHGLRAEKLVCILSKAVWGHPGLVYSFPPAEALQYFENAVIYLEKMLRDWPYAPGIKPSIRHRKSVRDMQMCLEYTLGLFRMRAFAQRPLQERLSMNNPLVRRLYACVERMIEVRIPIRTYLTLSIANKEQYQQIPDLLYALLVYIVGTENSSSIRISGVNFDDDGDDAVE